MSDADFAFLAKLMKGLKVTPLDATGTAAEAAAKYSKERDARQKKGYKEFLCSFRALTKTGKNKLVDDICEALAKLQGGKVHCEIQHAMPLIGDDGKKADCKAEKEGGSKYAHPSWLEFWKLQANGADCVLLFDSHCDIQTNADGEGYYHSAACGKEYRIATTRVAKTSPKTMATHETHRKRRNVHVGKWMDQGCPDLKCKCRTATNDFNQKTKGHNMQDMDGTKRKKLTPAEIAEKIWEDFSKQSADIVATLKAGPEVKKPCRCGSTTHQVPTHKDCTYRNEDGSKPVTRKPDTPDQKKAKAKVMKARAKEEAAAGKKKASK